MQKGCIKRVSGVTEILLFQFKLLSSSRGICMLWTIAHDLIPISSIWHSDAGLVGQCAGSSYSILNGDARNIVSAILKSKYKWNILLWSVLWLIMAGLQYYVSL